MKHSQAKRLQLDHEDRRLLESISRIVFVNPFSPRRSALDAAFSGLPSSAGPARHLERLLERVRGVLDRASEGRVGWLASRPADDRTVLEYGLLFVAFHDVVDPLDDLIREQIAHPDVPAPVPFASAILRRMTEAGLPDEVASRYFSMFYQLRRAYYFIKHGILGRSAPVARLRETLWNNVFTSDMARYVRHLWNRMEDFSTLLVGETGTGKGVAAAAIGRSGFIPFDTRQGCFTESFMQSFVDINLSQFSTSLIESELFGHRRGAFTGAVDAHRGVFSRCSPHGAIFLDEIADVPVPIQIKLLRVLQERVFIPVGGHEQLAFRGRVIAASNRSPARMQRESGFRSDFYYRLCSDVIEFPPLRDRLHADPGELRELLTPIVGRILGSADPDVVHDVESSIRRSLPSQYPWPGNVRELEQCVRRILLAGTYTPSLPVPGSDTFADACSAGTLSAAALLTRYCRHLYGALGTYEAVRQRTGLDRRTVKKYIDRGGED